MTLSVDWLVRELFSGLKLKPEARYFVALSGGVDSVVLLHLMAMVRQRQGIELAALHVNHNIHPDSGQWAEYCARLCAKWEIALHHTEVELDNHSELAARNARHAWFAQQVRYGDVIMTAHHRQDRAETFLFNLMRGAGSAGLSSMRARRPFQGALLVRPLLNACREQIVDYAQQHKLRWVEDPSNHTDDYSRNIIRHHVLPALTNYRSDALQNIARAAANLEEENGLLREIAISDLVDVREECEHPIDHSHALCTEDMAHLSPARQSNLLRFWLQSLNLHTPSRRFLQQLVAAIANPPAGTAVLQEGGKQFRFYRGFMYVMPALEENCQFGVVDWQNVAQPIDIFQSRWRLDSTQRLRELAQSQQGSTVKLAERSELANPKALQGHSLNVKKWMQEMAIPPWRRQSVPLLLINQNSTDIVLGAIDQQVHNDWVMLESGT